MLDNNFSIKLTSLSSDYQVVWKQLYSTSSGMERGTLYQLRNLINRRSVVKKVKSDVNACEDFLELVVTGHIIACAMQVLGMSAVNEIPTSTVIDSPEDVWMKDDTERKSILRDVTSQIVDQYIDLSTTFTESQPLTERVHDGIHAYSCESLSLGLLFLEFKDGVKEGDGERIMRVWQYFLLLFKASNRTNYSIEALTLLAQYHMILPPCLAEQLKWSRFINTHGLPGHNISCDLHMEHLNRLAKDAIKGLGANKSTKTIDRVGKAIGTITKSLANFDTVNNVPDESGQHSERSNEKDLHKIIDQLVKSRVFDVIPGRKHKLFPRMQRNYINSLSEAHLKEWMIEHYATLLCD